jgi:phage terminase large subunit-like protein
LLTQPEQERLAKLTLERKHRWKAHARASQIAPPGDWIIWLIMAGRGNGKTRTGAEWVRDKAESGKAGRIALVAKDAADARDVMVEGESGLLAISHPRNKPVYETSKRRVTWPNGAIATMYSSEDPGDLRGPQHDAAWCDELAKWKKAQETLDNLLMGLRLGTNPQVVITTTPQPIPTLKMLLKDPTVHITKGTTYENLENLSPAFRQNILRYEGTRLGRQELYAELLEDTPGALWTSDTLEASRLKSVKPEDLTQIVVAIDIATTSHAESDETGIVVVGKDAADEGYVLADYSGKYSPAGWARKALWALDKHQANHIVAEVNQGGDLVKHTIHTEDRAAKVETVHAARGKYTRAEPVAALYEQGKIHHVGIFPEMEDQMTTYVPGLTDSPDRMDALVWGLTQLLVTGKRVMTYA